MTRRERLMATLRGESVDRPAVNFYEITATKHNPNNPDPYNIYNDPSWRPLLDLAENQTDIIRSDAPKLQSRHPEIYDRHFRIETWLQDSSRFTRTSLTIAGRVLTQLTRRDIDVDTIWVIEHFLKDADDLRAYLELPDEIFQYEVDCSNLYKLETELGDAGIAMVETGDPICQAASLFSMEDYTILAMTEPELFHKLLQKLARSIHDTTETVARDFPGRLWRICGSEYASEPYLPPQLFKEYVVTYTSPMVAMIQRYGGFARIHSHGRLKNILPHIMTMNPDGLDPIEPPGQGDMELIEVRKQYGRQMILFGNIEISDIENLPPCDFQKKVEKAIREGTAGKGRGFVLMPSASPYGRNITERTLTNYMTMVQMVRK